MVSKGIGLRFGTFACLLIVVISSGLLRASESKRFSRPSYQEMQELERGILKDLKPYDKNYDHEKVEKIVTNPRYVGAEVCFTTPYEIVAFKHAECDVWDMGEKLLHNPARWCSSKALYLYAQRLIDDLIKKCQQEILPSLQASVAKIHGDDEKIVADVYAQLSRAESEVSEASKKGELAKFKELLHISTESKKSIELKQKLTALEQSLTENERYVRSCIVVIENIGKSLPPYRVHPLAKDNSVMLKWSNLLYPCKKHVLHYCVELKQWKEECLLGSSADRPSMLPECASKELDELDDKCRAVRDFIAPRPQILFSKKN